MTPARVCLVAPEFIGPFHNGGVGTSCYWEATTLAGAGFVVTVLYTGLTEHRSPAHWEQHYGARGFEYVDLSRWAHDTGAVASMSHLDTGCSEARVSQLVLEFLRTRCFDVVLFQEFLGHGARALQARESRLALHGARTAVTLHSCRQWIFEGMQHLPATRDDGIVDFLERESARLADRLVAPSQSMAAWVQDRWRLRRPLDVIPNCYDEQVTGRRAVTEHPGPFRHLVFFGRLETRKGLHVFVRALERSPTLAQHVERVTFLGRHSRVDERPSEQFLEERMSRLPWLRSEIRADLGSLEALTWLQEQRSTLVVVPSVGDNLPYAVVELYSRRIPFVSTNVGGIPEIVGARNAHVLASPDVVSIQRLLERICVDARFSMDYHDGYDAEEANRAHIALVHQLAAERSCSAVNVRRSRELSVVVTGARTARDIDQVRDRLRTSELPAQTSLTCCTREEWAGREHGDTAALFIDADVIPDRMLVTRLLAALENPAVDLATPYFRLSTSGTALFSTITPLGESLENGWRWNCFGGPCLIARGAALPVLRDACRADSFAFWTAFAALACHGIGIAVIPEPLYAIAAEPKVTAADIHAIASLYHTCRPATLDIGWLLKTSLTSRDANAAIGARRQTGSYAAQAVTESDRNAAHSGRVLYDRFLAIPDDELRAYAELDATLAKSDSVYRDLLALRSRLEPIVARWQGSKRRVFISGAGEHTRMLLGTCPSLGPLVDGFIDVRGIEEFLGKPCVHPDAFNAGMADAIVYSSRAFERDMYSRLAAAPVEHVLLYASHAAGATS